MSDIQTTRKNKPGFRKFIRGKSPEGLSSIYELREMGLLRDGETFYWCPPSFKEPIVETFSESTYQNVYYSQGKWATIDPDYRP